MCCSVLQCVAVCCSVLQCVIEIWRLHISMRQQQNIKYLDGTEPPYLCSVPPRSLGGYSAWLHICMDPAKQGSRTHTHTHMDMQIWIHCNTLQHTATHCNTLQHIEPPYLYICMDPYRYRYTDMEAQCVAVCCSALQCVAVCCSVLQCVIEIWRLCTAKSRRLREVGGWGRDPFSRNFMKPTPRRKWYLTTGRRFH